MEKKLNKGMGLFLVKDIYMRESPLVAVMMKGTWSEGPEAAS